MSSFGEELRRERELREITLEEIAGATKVKLRFLEALERNDFDSLPGGLFTRGFIRAYAMCVGLDPEKMVNAYLYQVAQEEEKAALTDAHRPQHRLEPSPEASKPERPARAWLVPMVGAAAAIVVLGTLGYVWFSRPGDVEAGPAVPADGARPAQRAASDDPSREAPIAVAEAAPETPLAGDPGVDAAPQEAEDPAAAAVPPEAAEHLLEIFPRDANHVRVSCGEVDLVDRPVAAGERIAIRCATAMRLHARHGGSLDLRLDGRDLEPPGREGVPLRNWRPPTAGEGP